MIPKAHTPPASFGDSFTEPFVNTYEDADGSISDVVKATMLVFNDVERAQIGLDEMISALKAARDAIPPEFRKSATVELAGISSGYDNASAYLGVTYEAQEPPELRLARQEAKRAEDEWHAKQELEQAERREFRTWERLNAKYGGKP